MAWQITFLIIAQRSDAISGDDFAIGAGEIQLRQSQPSCCFTSSAPAMIFGAGMVDLLLGALFIRCVAAAGCSIMR